MALVQSFFLLLARALNAAIIIRILLSWIPIDRSSQFMATILDLIYSVTEPILGPIRRVIPSIGGLDFSPMVAVLLIQMVTTIIARL